jgi:hypothetical protein
MAVGVRGDLKPLTCQEIPLYPPFSKGGGKKLPLFQSLIIQDSNLREF